MSRAKQKSLLLLSTAAVLTLILAMSLPNLVLSPGQPFSLEPPKAEAPGESGLLPGGEIIMKIFQGIIALAIIFLPIYIIFSLLTAEGRRRLLVQILLLALLLLAADYLRSRTQEEETEPQDVTAAQAMNWGQLPESSPAVVFTAEPPPEFVLFVMLMLSILTAALAAFIFRAVWRRTRTPVFTFEKLAEEAQTAISSIYAGEDVKAAIMRCYLDMSRVIKEEKGIARETFMTPHEFEEHLISKGFSQKALSTLTRLFEQVRYSSIPAGPHEQHLAVQCLTDIIEACRVMKNPP